MKTDDQGIIKMLEQKIAAHEEKISSFRQAIMALSGFGISSSSPSTGRKRRGRKSGIKNLKKAEVKAGRKRRRRRSKTNVNLKPRAVRRQRRPRSGETMESWVIKQMEDGVPKTTRTLMEIFNKETGRNLDISGVSARLAIIKKKGTLKSAKNNNDGLSYLGKAEWFENGNLKEEYLPKTSS
jgi:hypothetical protein